MRTAADDGTRVGGAAASHHEVPRRAFLSRLQSVHRRGLAAIATAALPQTRGNRSPQAAPAAAAPPHPATGRLTREAAAGSHRDVRGRCRRTWRRAPRREACCRSRRWRARQSPSRTPHSAEATSKHRAIRFSAFKMCWWICQTRQRRSNRSATCRWRLHASLCMGMGRRLLVRSPCQDGLHQFRAAAGIKCSSSMDTSHPRAHCIRRISD